MGGGGGARRFFLRFVIVAAVLHSATVRHTTTLARPYYEENTVRGHLQFVNKESAGKFSPMIVNYTSSQKAEMTKNAFDSLKSDDDYHLRRRAERKEKRRKDKERKKAAVVLRTEEFYHKYPLMTLPPVESIDERLPEGWKDALSKTYNEQGHTFDNMTCTAHPFKQSVKQEGCLTKVVINRFCWGVCSSLFIPRMRAKKLKAHFESVTKCAPSDHETLRVVLECPQQNPPVQTKIITIVKACSCQAIDLGDPHH